MDLWEVKRSRGLFAAQQQGHEIVVGEIEKTRQTIMVVHAQRIRMALKESFHDKVVLEQTPARPPAEPPSQILWCQFSYIGLAHERIGLHTHGLRRSGGPSAP